MPNEPILLCVTSHDSLFHYASGFDVEQGLYIRFGPGDDVLAVSGLEVDRARVASPASRIVDRAEVGWVEQRDVHGSWAGLAAGLLRERGVDRVRIAPTLPAAVYAGLRRAGVEAEIEPELLVAERRRKSEPEIECIASAQRAAEAACTVVVRHLAEAQAKGEILHRDGRPLTSEWLMTEAQRVLGEHGCVSDEMIICGAPDNAMGHARGAGPIRAGAPVVIDIFPRHRESGYHGDLTRTVVAGPVPAVVREMYEASLAALEAGLAALREGVDGQEVHRAACRTLVEHGFGSYSPGLEGRLDRPRMVHSTGHGVGLEVHEPPQLRDVSWALGAGDVVTVEPGLYQLGLGGVRVEDTVVVTASGHRNLTTLTRSLDPAAYL
jgi:Xaa-Pro aminopeptidase